MAVMTVDEALGLAREHIQAGRVIEGEGVCRAILEGAPEEAEAHRLLGLLACTAGKLTLAESYVRKALECREDFAEAHLALCMIFAAQRRFAEAEDSARAGAGCCADFAEAHNNLGGALQGLGRFDEAVAAFRRALARARQLLPGRLQPRLRAPGPGALARGGRGLRACPRAPPGTG